MAVEKVSARSKIKKTKSEKKNSKKATLRRPPAKRVEINSGNAPSFRKRCIYFFGKTLEEIDEIRALLDEDEITDVDLELMNCFRNLSYSIEMFAKATLQRKTPFLLAKDLKGFENLFQSNHVYASVESCGAKVALARASKLFQAELHADELGRLIKVIDIRNECEHGMYVLSEFQSEINTIANAAEILQNLYNREFRSKLLTEAAAFFNSGILETYKGIIKEASEEFISKQALAKELTKEGVEFIDCFSCFYPFAQIESSKIEYNCILCGDRRFLSKCVVPGCKTVFWSSSNDSQLRCQFHTEEGMSSWLRNMYVHYNAKDIIREKNSNFSTLSESDKIRMQALEELAFPEFKLEFKPKISGQIVNPKDSTKDQIDGSEKNRKKNTKD